MDIPEKQLWASVLMQAIIDYQDNPTKYKTGICQKVSKYWQNNASHWIFRSYKTGIGSFDWVCKSLSLPVSDTRKSIKNGGIKLTSNFEVMP